jgi:hypothetical protein
MEYVFRSCVARRPTTGEYDVMKKLLAQQRDRFAADEAAAQQLLAEKPIEGTLIHAAASPAAEQAAWMVLCRVLMNLDETITKE